MVHFPHINMVIRAPNKPHRGWVGPLQPGIVVVVVPIISISRKIIILVIIVVGGICPTKNTRKSNYQATKNGRAKIPWKGSCC